MIFPDTEPVSDLKTKTIQARVGDLLEAYISVNFRILLQNDLDPK
jgi:hypothetical protein